MWRNILIFLPLVTATLQLGGLLNSAAGRLLSLALIFSGFIVIFKKRVLPRWQTVLRSALLSLGGACTTFLLANYLGLGILLGSAVVALVGARFLSDQDQLVLYLGTFVGMSSTIRFPTFLPLVAAGLLGGILWEALDESWVGVGGRLGTLAATAVLIVLVFSGGGI